MHQRQRIKQAITQRLSRMRALGRKAVQAVPPRWRIIAKTVWDFVKEPALAILPVLAATTALAQPFYVPSGSMEPTIQIGDELLASKFAYGYSRYSVPFALGPSSSSRLLERLPDRGDVVVFRLPRDSHQTYVKRVIGLPGDHVQMREGRLWINGEELPLKRDGSTYVEAEDGTKILVPRYVETLPNGHAHWIFKVQWDGPLDNTPVFVVPKNHVFAMGDNRDNSLDSRVAEDQGGVGYVPMENLVGRADVVLGSVDYLNAHSLLGWPAEFRTARLMKKLQ
jgi:signal peptidase I